MSEQRKDHGSEPPTWPVMVWVWGGIAVTLLLLSFVLPDATNKRVEIPYSEAKALISSGEVRSVRVGEHDMLLVLDRPEGLTDDSFRTVLPIQGDPSLLPLLEERGVEVEATPPEPESVLFYLLPWVMIIAFWFWMQNRITGGAAGGIGGSGGLWRGRFSTPASRHQGITFDDVAGQDNAKREVAELVEFLKDPERFDDVGAQVPHGVLLVGPPGTGKTLLAKALAGEADVPFYSTSGSEFIEVFVGVGAGRVRKMFEAARKSAPSIIFIDELDSIGRTRGTGLGGGHDEREQTLNQILAEMDGFDEREAVVVLAATNRPDVLDPALLRPGRFDRHVTLNLPDRNARRAILDIHAKYLPIANRSDLDAVAAGTPGFSGADLKNLLNEAAITAARQRSKLISHADLDEARDKIMMGTVRSLAIHPDEKHRLAVHEAGHAAVAYYTPEADPLYKVTIIPRGRALGGTHMIASTERHTYDENYLKGQLTTLLAGHAAEKLFLGTTSSGAEDDIHRSTELARSMVAKWGMADGLGPIDLHATTENPFLGRSIAQPSNCAEATAAKVDDAVMQLLGEARENACAVLSAHKDKVLRLVAELEKEESLELPVIRELLGRGGGAKLRPV